MCFTFSLSETAMEDSHWLMSFGYPLVICTVSTCKFYSSRTILEHEVECIQVDWVVCETIDCVRCRSAEGV